MLKQRIKKIEDKVFIKKARVPRLKVWTINVDETKGNPGKENALAKKYEQDIIDGKVRHPEDGSYYSRNDLNVFITQKITDIKLED